MTTERAGLRVEDLPARWDKAADDIERRRYANPAQNTGVNASRETTLRDTARELRAVHATPDEPVAGLAIVPDHVWRYQQGSEHLLGCCIHADARLREDAPR